MAEILFSDGSFRTEYVLLLAELELLFTDICFESQHSCPDSTVFERLKTHINLQMDQKDISNTPLSYRNKYIYIYMYVLNVDVLLPCTMTFLLYSL